MLSDGVIFDKHNASLQGVISMKFIRIMFSVLLVLGLVLLSAVGALIYFVDPNQYKTVLVDAVQKKTGYQLAVTGKLRWSFYPQLGIKVPHLSLKQPTEDKAFLVLDRVHVAVNVMQLLHGIDALDGSVRAASVQLLAIHAQNLRVGLQWHSQVLTLSPISAKLYQGTLEGSAHGSQFSTNPKWFWTVQLAGLQMQPLMDDVHGANALVSLSGEAHMIMHATTEGKSREDILKHLNGTLNVVLKNGAIQGVNLDDLIQYADAIINKSSLPESSHERRTPFNRFTGSFLVKNGEARTDNLSIKAMSFSTQGEGVINLPEDRMNMQFNIASAAQIKTHWEIPVVIEGQLAQPVVRLDANELGRLITVKELKQVKGRVGDHLKTQLHDKVERFVGHLLDH